VAEVDIARSVALNEQELWREMVRWAGGVVHEQDGLLFVAGPSSYLRVMIRVDGGVDGAEAVRRAGEHFATSAGDHIVLVCEPADADLAKAGRAAGYTPAWTERPMAIREPPEPSPLTDDIDLRIVSSPTEVIAYGRVVAQANDDPGERERAGLLFRDRTILAPHIAAFVAYVDDVPVACAMTPSATAWRGCSTWPPSRAPADGVSATRSRARRPVQGSR
jgi:hypothetical protein